MNNSHKETISIRIISCAFMVLAIAIFKPFGLEVWQWQTCVHLMSVPLFSKAIAKLCLKQ